MINDIISREGGEIDRDRIVDGDLVPEEYFCPICQYLLWKPRSCSSCQHLFCEKCIRRWIDNPSSRNKCPFRCEPFEDRRCPPYVQSLLSRLNIHCRNSSFGCLEILSYDQLEYHENVQCEYLTKRCEECEQLILLSKYDEHEQIEGLCVPCPIKCTICQDFIEKSLFREHFHRCCEEKINQSMTRIFTNQNNQTGRLNPAVPPNNGMVFLQTILNTVRLFEEQKQMSRLPTSLKGVDAVQRAREQNGSHLYHVLIMLKFLLLNWKKIPFFIFNIALGGFIAIALLLLGGYTIFCHWTCTHIYRGSFFLILFSCLSSYGTDIIFQFFSDGTIIFFFGLSIFLWGCTSRMSLEMLEMSFLFNKDKVCIALCCLSLLIVKIILLLLRFYYWLIPTWLAALLCTFLNFCVAFQIHRVYLNTAASVTTNQLLMTV